MTSNDLGVAIAGAGYFGAFHADAIAELAGVRLVAICDLEPAHARHLAARHAGARVAAWPELLADPAVDVVVIATPHHHHHAMAVAAAAAGKHILLEKPMALTAAECTAIIEAAERHGVKLMVGQLLHFALPSVVGRAILQRGELGQPLIASSTLNKLWLEPNRRAWHLDPSTGGGMLMTAGIHALDLLVWLMDAPVATVFAAAGALLHAQAADDSALLLVRFADGRFGQVSSIGYRDGGVAYGIDLICERGSLRIDFARGVAIGRGGQWTPVAETTEPDWMARALVREWQALAAAVRGSAPIPVSGAYGRHIIACIEAALQSSRERREVAVAPELVVAT